MSVPRTSLSASAHRRNALWLAALAHRLSGIGLALFLPLHFLMLGLALRGEAALQAGLRYTDQPLVKLAEGGLVFLLGVHFLGGVRLLVVENFAWRDGQKNLAAAAFAVAACTGLFYMLRIL